jgi:hypothetical protein
MIPYTTWKSGRLSIEFKLGKIIVKLGAEVRSRIKRGNFQIFTRRCKNVSFLFMN